jgi:ADP-L-glycero-D-manno-heptose 6-epimerase
LDEDDFINICKKIANTKSRQNFQKNTKILVTGALGFIGKSLLEYLRDKGHYVDIYVKKNWTKRWEELVELKVHRPFHENILDIIKNYDIVVHLAANSSTTAPENQETWDNNYTLTSSIIEGCIKNNVKLILASSASVYGNSGKINKEDDEVNPQHFYGATKAIIDTNLPIFNNEEIYSLRFFNVYGKNEDRKGKMSSVIYKWLTQDINEGNKIKIFKSNSEKFKDGEQCRDFIFVEDVCSIIYHCMKSEFKGGIYNVGTGKPETWNNVAKIILKIRGLPEEMIEYIDIPEEIKNQYQNFTQACTDKLRNKLGYTKEFTRLEDAIKKTWLEINGK